MVRHRHEPVHMQEASLLEQVSRCARPVSYDKMYQTADSFQKVKSEGNLQAAQDHVVLESCHKVSRKMDSYLLSKNVFYNVRHLKNNQ